MGGAVYVRRHEYMNTSDFVVTDLSKWSKEKEALGLALHFFISNEGKALALKVAHNF